MCFSDTKVISNPLHYCNVFTPVCHSVHRGSLPHPPGQTLPPLRSACWDTVNKWAVHILLECQRSAKKQSTNYITTAHQRSGEGYVFSRFCLRDCPCTGLYPTPGHVQLGPHCTWTPPPKDMFKLVQYVTRTVGKAGGWYSTEMPSCSIVMFYRNIELCINQREVNCYKFLLQTYRSI